MGAGESPEKNDGICHARFTCQSFETRPIVAITDSHQIEVLGLALQFGKRLDQMVQPFVALVRRHRPTERIILPSGKPCGGGSLGADSASSMNSGSSESGM